MTLVMFIWNINSFKIVFIKDTFERKNHLFDQILVKIIFKNDGFEKYKNFGQKMPFKKIIFTFKNVFHVKRVYISNKHHKNYIWLQNFKKNIFLATLTPTSWVTKGKGKNKIKNLFEIDLFLNSN